MASFRINPNLHRDLSRSAELRDAIRERAENVAREAERIGRAVADGYEAEVVDTGEGFRVDANAINDRGVNVAGWIEWGTGAPAPTPAYAPLRKGVEAAGLDTRAR